MDMGNNKIFNEQNHIPRYGLRKLSLGVASVVLGTTITIVGSNITANADTNDQENTAVSVDNNETPAPAINEQTPADSQTNTTTDPSQDGPSANTPEGPSNPTVGPDGTPLGPDGNPINQEKQINVVPIQTSVGVVSDAKQAIANWSNTANNLSRNDTSMFTVSWATAPNVENVGTVTGELKVTYAGNEYNEETGQFNAVTKTVPVTIYVTGKDETINNESDVTGEDLVTNTVQYVNKKTGQIIRTDKYTGEKDSSTASWENKPISEADLEQTFRFAGYELYQNSQEGYEGKDDVHDSYDTSTTFSDVLQFGETNQYFTIYLTPISSDHGGQTSDEKDVVPVLRDTVADFYLDFVKELPNPRIFIANLNQLPADTKVEWKVKPEYDLTQQDGTYLNPVPTNTSIISVTYNGKTIDLGEEDHDTLFMLSMSSEYPSINGNVQELLNGELPSFEEVVIPAQNKDDFPYNSFYWVVKLDLSHIGVTYGEVASPNYPAISMFVMIDVRALESKTETMTVNRTIRYDVSGTKNAAIPDQTQEVTYSRVNTINPINNEVITYGAWTPASAQFPQQDVVPITGYDSYVNGVKADKVSAATITTDENATPQDGTTVTVTDKKSETPVTPVTPDKPSTDPTTNPTTDPTTDPTEDPTIPTDPQAGDKEDKITSEIVTPTPGKNSEVEIETIKPTDVQSTEIKQVAQKTLPQTGNADQSASVASLAVAGFIAMLGLSNFKKKKD